ncbi:conserved hypothetical protein [Anaeromyxobacter dehalogenans 2CP-1]|uniref:Uncharacterized protein n=1 Tax=Anaeromyxobacter dehalogenans (strain ATCC BAA-258 / DSM 21875 / 2CP-1) TaxID=455488 RepID=B8JHG2_ANAD2|nr:DUF4384 domain-containing protein [Anaeromyxobacter dehalogenans]ACL66674.1 conserved hypothetical protein [Anaeromyxobacter dehalogenans 2CP-1]
MTACPSDLRLEALLLAPDGADAAHVTACPACQERLAEMRAEGEAFAREVYPATVDAVVASVRATPAAAPRPAPRLHWLRFAVPLAAAAAVAVFLLVRLRPAPTVELSVFVQDAARAAPVADGEPVPATASLRFEVHPSSPCCLWILSVDPKGNIARLYPPKGDKASEELIHPAEPHALPTTAVLDGQAGPARIFAVCTKAPVPWPKLKDAAAKRLEKGDEAVRQLRAIGGLPRGSAQTSVLIEKRG